MVKFSNEACSTHAIIYTSSVFHYSPLSLSLSLSLTHTHTHTHTHTQSGGVLPRLGGLRPPQWLRGRQFCAGLRSLSASGVSAATPSDTCTCVHVHVPWTGFNYILKSLCFRGLKANCMFNRPFSADVTSCSLINQQCWIARIFSQNILYEVLR